MEKKQDGGAGGWGQAIRGCLVQTEFQFGEIKTFSGWTVVSVHYRVNVLKSSESST